MVTRYPKYYKDFRCIADKCTDNCCIGWDIYIDDKTLSLYKALKGEDGEPIASRVDMTGGAHFKMKGGRCPFLDSLGLCEIIKLHGDETLCEICAEHPRFYNRVKNLTECGVGASCPTAAELILRGDATLVTEGEESSIEQDERLSVILDARKNASDLLRSDEDITATLKKLLILGNAMEDADFDDDFTVDRIMTLCGERQVPSVEARYAKEDAIVKIFEYFSAVEVLNTSEYSIFERIYKSRDDIIAAMNDKIGDKKIQESLKRIAEYFVYRYLTPTYYTGEFSAVMKLTLVSCVVILALISEKNDIGICDAFKEYSKQIEYNPDTMDKLLADLYSLDFFETAELISLI